MQHATQLAEMCLKHWRVKPQEFGRGACRQTADRSLVKQGDSYVTLIGLRTQKVRL